MSEFPKYLEAERGRTTWLAAELDVTPSAVSQWAISQVPAERIFRVSELTGIPLNKLRPDLFQEGGKAA